MRNLMKRFPRLALAVRRSGVSAGRALRAAQADHLPPLCPSLMIPICEQTDEEVDRDRYFRQGRFLARQEDWAELGRLVIAFDSGRIRTCGGTSAADILCRGARADATEACVAAARRGDLAGSRQGLHGLDAVAEEFPDDPGVALTVALAHIDAGRVWRGMSLPNKMPDRNRAVFDGHFHKAAHLLAGFDAFDLDLPMIAAATCELMTASDPHISRVATAYEDAIDLDPANPDHMRKLGIHMLPQWGGTYDRLENEARRAANRLRPTWGKGGYAWVYLDALALDPRAYDTLDVDFFVKALQDILRFADTQHMANLLAAHIGTVLSCAGDALPDTPRARVLNTLDWIVGTHLREVHPAVWARAATCNDPLKPAPTPANSLSHGRAQAIGVLRDLFRPQIEAGCRVQFIRKGRAAAPGRVAPTFPNAVPRSI